MRFLPTRTRRHRLAVAATAAVVALGGGTAAVVAATTTSAPAGTVALAAATAPAVAGSGHHPRGLLARTDHAAVELKVKGQWVTYDLDRGKVTAVSATSITLARPDGQSVTLAIDSATRFGHKVVAGGAASAAAITVGARATVVSEDGTARRVVQALHPARKTAAPSTSATA